MTGLEPSRSHKRVVFLDKDGTLLEDVPYNVDPSRVRFAPGARDGLRLLGRHGWPIAIVTNQSGVARGYFTLDDLARLADHLRPEVERLGAEWAGFYACPHLPDGINAFAIECDCRKPAPGLLVQAADELGADLSRSWFVGDTWMDVAAGRAAGCRTILVGREWRLEQSWSDDRRPDHAVPDLLGAAELIVGMPAPVDAGARTTALARPTRVVATAEIVR
jgi:D-glycero-D-manno-heptose 1,7-bisphosphate phosphatase